MNFRGRDFGQADRSFAEVEKRRMDFQEADRRFAEARRKLDDGSMSHEEFDAERQRLMLQDHEGRWWAKGRKTGEWSFHDGGTWVKGTPPGYQPASPAEQRQPRLEQSQQSPPAQATFPVSGFTRHWRTGKQRRWLAASILGIMMASVLGVAGVVGTAPAFALVEGDPGSLSVEVPSEWSEHFTAGTEPVGEKGKSWSSFLGENAGPSVTAINDLDAWRTGARPHKGVYMVASKKLAQEYTDDELVASGPNDYSGSCEAGPVRDFDRGPYSGRIQEWTDCGGEGDHFARTVVAAPEGRECVVLLQIGGYLRGEEENIRHILDTFEADCRSIE